MSQILTNTISFTGATPTTLFLLPLANNSIYGFTVKAVVFDAADGESAFYETKFAVKRFSGGVATAVGSPVEVIVVEDDNTWALTVGVDGGNNARVQFTAGSGDTVTVRGELEFIKQPI